MDDFASATMVRLLVRGMAARGMQVPVQVPTGGRIPLADKRRVVQAAIDQGGLAALLQLGHAIEHIDGEPVHQALIAARDPLDFMQRWQRLEQYVHATHRVRLLAQASGQLQLAHEARVPGSSSNRPLPAESLAVLGVLIGSFEAIGARDLSVQVDGRSVHPVAQEADLQALARTGRASEWRLQWRPGERLPVRPALRCPTDLCDPLRWPSLALGAARRLLADPAAPNRLADAAQALRVSRRSLQRLLTTHGLNYSGVVAEARSRAAAWWLINSVMSVAEIGFLCGFADQSHFTREFSRRVGPPPAKYRQAAKPGGQPSATAA